MEIFAAFYPRFHGEPVLADDLGSSYAAGLVYRGLLPQRDSDALGVGLVWAELYQGGTNQETAYEFFYRAVVTQRVSIQPDLQYIVSPVISASQERKI